MERRDAPHIGARQPVGQRTLPTPIEPGELKRPGASDKTNLMIGWILQLSLIHI